VAWLFLFGCVHTTPLQVAQTGKAALDLAQETEAELCWGVADVYHGPADRTTCTTSTAAAVGLTSAKHQQFNAKLHQAYDLERTSAALLAAGQTADWTSFNAVLSDIIVLLQTLQQTPTVLQLQTQVKAGQR